MQDRDAATLLHTREEEETRDWGSLSTVRAQAQKTQDSREYIGVNAPKVSSSNPKRSLTAQLHREWQSQCHPRKVGTGAVLEFPPKFKRALEVTPHGAQGPGREMSVLAC